MGTAQDESEVGRLAGSTTKVIAKIKTEKGIRWMPWYYEPMKDAVTSEMPRGGGKQPLIRGCPNGETCICEAYVPLYRGIY